MTNDGTQIISLPREAIHPGQPADFQLLMGGKFVNGVPVDDGPLTVFKAAQILEDGGYTGDPRIRGVGSSTMADTDGDRFMPNCLKSIQTNLLGLNVLLEHRPTFRSIFGSVMDSKMDKRMHLGSEYDVLEVESDVLLKNPEAVEVYEMIAGIGTRPRQFGYSVGCIYTDVRRRQQKAYGRVGVDVHDAYPGEVSVIPMPSNRLSWIETVKKSMQSLGHLPANAPEGWLDRDVQYVLANREDFVSTDTDLEGIRAWKALSTIAEYLEDECGVKICLPRRAA